MYINANEGQSSGGHSGLRIGSNFYHFQYYNDNIFHLVREKWTEFLYIYNSSDNRKVQSIELSLTKDAIEKISSFWNEFYLIQKKQLDIKDFLLQDIVILEAIQNQKEISVPGMAYLNLSSTKNDSPGKMNLNLSNLSKKIKQTTDILQNIQYSSFSIPDPKKEEYPKSINFFSQQILDALQKKQALECLQMDCQISTDSFFLLDPYLKDGEKLKLLSLWKKYLPLLEKKMQTYLNDSRDHSGRSFLITMIRYKYMMYSLKTNSIYLPDLYPNTVGMYTFQNKEKGILEEVEKQFGIYFSHKFQTILNSKSISEENLQSLEDSANRYHDFLSHKNNSLPIRSYDQLLLPLKGRNILLPNYKENLESLSISLNNSKIVYKEFENKLQKLYPFDLLTENCTTEIFTNLHRNLENKDENIIKILGGKLSEKENFNFIPFVAYRNVRQYYRKKQERTIDSFRIRKILEMKKIESSLWVEVRESNTLTSKIYKANGKDSFFIFFTDNNILLRPIYGTINLLAGVSQLGMGLVVSPWDRGDTLKTGGNGILFSLPELFFFNIRKGTFVDSDEYQNLFFGEREDEN